ncbi:cytochrome P450 [Xylariaceae sp. FL0255]|nr:cytochrome P450 [Xylariaceae sp. FL0255]
MDILVACFVAHYALLKWYRVFVYPKYHSLFRYFPGPKMREHSTVPLICYLIFANREVLVVNSLQSYKDLLQLHCYSFQKPASLRRILKAIAGDGIFILEGQRHQAYRKMLNTYFSCGKLYKLRPTFQYMAKELSSLRRPEASQFDGVGIYSTYAWIFHKAYAAIFTQDLAARTLVRIIRERYRNYGDFKSYDLLTSLVKESAAGGPAKGLSEDDINIQTAVYAEISKLLRQKPSSTLTDIDKLAYLKNFVIETLRIYSPDRLIGDQHSAYTFKAFSNRPRICIGRGFALREIKAILFEMVRAFQFLEVVEPFKIENPGFTLRPAGLRVLCRKR